MDFLDPTKKRAHDIRLFIGYGLISIVIGIISLILLYQAYGYDLDRKTGQVIQNGLVYLDSNPVGSNVFVNGQNKGRTDVKLVIPSDTYDIELREDKYKSWHKTIRLEGGSIEQLTYPFLFPSKLVTKDQQFYAKVPQLATQSPDKRWLLILPTGTLTRFEMFDINSSNVTRTSFEVPASLFTAASGDHKVSLVEWSRDNKHLLLKHDYQGGSEFILIDRTAPNTSLNLTKTLSLNPVNTAVSLRDKLYDKYYVYDTSVQALQTIDLESKQLKTLLGKVLYFKTFGANTVVYVTTDNKDPKTYAVNIWDGSKNYLIHDYPSDSEYRLDIANFSGSTYLVIASVSKGAAYIYKDPLSQAKSGKIPTPFMLLRLAQPKFISFSTNARFIAVQSGSNFAVYDIDMNRRFYYQLSEPVAEESKATWMDGHRLTSVSSQKLSVFDFDGSNRHQLTSNYTGFTPFFDQGYKKLYNIAPSVNTAQSHALTNTPLVIEP